jgi:hypothetical protein
MTAWSYLGQPASHSPAGPPLGSAVRRAGYFGCRIADAATILLLIALGLIQLLEPRLFVSSTKASPGKR